jgi:hypothetical protein
VLTNEQAEAITQGMVAVTIGFGSWFLARRSGGEAQPKTNRLRGCVVLTTATDGWNRPRIPALQSSNDSLCLCQTEYPTLWGGTTAQSS